LKDTFEKKSGGLKLEQADATKTVAAFIKPDGAAGQTVYAAVGSVCSHLNSQLKDAATLRDVAIENRGATRSDLFLLQKSMAKLKADPALDSKEASDAATTLAKSSSGLTNYIPDWVKYAVAVALGCGTMIGWKRIVVTVGEKIGKSHLTYAQGASAE